MDTSGGGDLEQMLAVICQQAADAVESERAAVYLWGPGGELQLAWLHGADDHEGGEAAAVPIGGLAKGPASLAVDPGTDLGGPWSPRAGVTAVLLTPLRANGAPLGVLALARTRRARPYEAVCRRIAEAVGQQGAQFIDATRRFEGERAALRRQHRDTRTTDHVAGLSHDLRSPLTAMLGYVRTLRTLDETLAPVERIEFLDIMERQIRRLSGMVDDILIGARLDSGHLRPDVRSDVDLAELAAAIRTTLTPTHRERVRLQAAGAPGVCGDRRQLERVIQNLVDNALAHNPASTVVTVRTAATAAGGALLAVHDDGPPIAPAVLGGLFERYGGQEPRQVGSTGLGLYTARGIVEAHGGRITATSDATSGTTFEVRLPAAPSDAASSSRGVRFHG